MKGAREAIEKGFQDAGSEIEDLAKKLELEVESIADLAAYTDFEELEGLSAALTEAKNFKDLINQQRTKLSELAKVTINKCETIRKKFEQMVNGTKNLDSGMRSVLRKMKFLLKTSETKLEEAKVVTIELTEKINKVLISLRVFKGLIEAAKKKEEALSKNLPVDYREIYSGIFASLRTGIVDYRATCIEYISCRKGYRRDEDNTLSIAASILDGITITGLSTGLVDVLTKPEIAPKVAEALQSVDEAQAIFKKQKEFMTREIELVIIWRDVVQTVYNDVFYSKLSDREEGEHYFELYDEVEEIIEDDDTENIYEAFEGLKDAAQTYLDQVKESCLACTQ